jgi:Domain of unknown function (DUF4260)
MYVLETSNHAGPPTPGTGDIVRIDPSGAHTTIVSGLTFPCPACTPARPCPATTATPRVPYSLCRDPCAGATAATLTGRSRIHEYPGTRSPVLAVALHANSLILLIGSDADWWPAVASAVAPDLAVLYGLAHPQLHAQAVPLHNALHRFWGPLAPIIVTAAAGLPRAWLAAGLAWAFHVAFDRAIGLRLRSPDGFQRGDRI